MESCLIRLIWLIQEHTNMTAMKSLLFCSSGIDAAEPGGIQKTPGRMAGAGKLLGGPESDFFGLPAMLVLPQKVTFA